MSDEFQIVSEEGGDPIEIVDNSALVKKFYDLPPYGIPDAPPFINIRTEEPEDDNRYFRDVFTASVMPMMPPRCMAYHTLRWSNIYNLTWQQRAMWKYYDLIEWLEAIHFKWCYE